MSPASTTRPESRMARASSASSSEVEASLKRTSNAITFAPARVASSMRRAWSARGHAVPTSAKLGSSMPTTTTAGASRALGAASTVNESKRASSRAVQTPAALIARTASATMAATPQVRPRSLAKNFKGSEVHHAHQRAERGLSLGVAGKRERRE